MICFYHDDLDGHACAAIVRYWHEKKKIEGRLILQELNHNQQINIGMIQYDEMVVLCDFSFDRETMKEIDENKTTNFIWIDHHYSAIVENADLNLKGVRDENYAACELTWNHFFPSQPFPGVIQLVGDSDVRRDAYGDSAMLFKLGFELYETNPKYDLAWKYWKGLLGPDEYSTQYYINKATEIVRYKKKQQENYVKNNAFYASFVGMRAICCNWGLTGSDLFDIVPKETYDIAVLFVHDGLKYKYALYTPHPSIDCSQVARRYDKNGGGHKFAAGFVHYDFLPEFERKYNATQIKKSNRRKFR